MVVPIILVDIVRIFIVAEIIFGYLIAHGTFHRAAHSHSRGGPATKDHRRVYRPGKLTNIGRQHRQDDQSIGLARAGANTAVR